MACELDLAHRARQSAGALRAVTLRFGGVDCVDQHRRDLSDAGSVDASRNGVEPGDDDQREQQSRARAGGRPSFSASRTCRRRSCSRARPTPSCPKHGSEPYDVSKAADQSPDSRAGHRPGAERQSQRHRAGDRRGRIVDVPARPRDGVARRSTTSRSPTTSRPSRCEASWPSSTRSGRLRGGRFCRPIVRMRSAGSPGTRARRRRDT